MERSPTIMPTLTSAILLVLALNVVSAAASASRRGGQEAGRDGKLLSLFQIVTFPNDVCQGSGSKNGTCYTAEECSSRSGAAAGSCASGYGVCCVFSAGCGRTSSENCTYFESTGSEVGDCTLTICKCNTNICQLRLDFNQFMISGPSTSTASVGKIANTNAFTDRGTCITDSFAVTSPGNDAPPVICGTNPGEHMYVDASDVCNDLTFVLGSAATATTRQWSIKVTQYSCDFRNLAPSGCTQYFFDTTGQGMVKTFNFDGGLHLVDQNHEFCIRRERNNCRICYSIAATTDFELSSSMTAVKGTASKCCGYGAMSATTNGFDCLVIPNASKSTLMRLTFSEFCGSGKTFSAFATTKTVCSSRLPFRLSFLSDNAELTMKESMATIMQAGFKLTYFQSGGC